MLRGQPSPGRRLQRGVVLMWERLIQGCWCENTSLSKYLARMDYGSRWRAARVGWGGRRWGLHPATSWPALSGADSQTRALLSPPSPGVPGFHLPQMTPQPPPSSPPHAPNIWLPTQCRLSLSPADHTQGQARTTGQTDMGRWMPEHGTYPKALKMFNSMTGHLSTGPGEQPQQMVSSLLPACHPALLGTRIPSPILPPPP